MNALTMLDPSQSDTRERIATVAEQLFREIGYQKTTVADIAKALQMSPANVYRFFASKKAINEAVAERVTQELRDRLLAVVRSKRPARERLRALLLAMHRNMDELNSEARLQEMVAAAMSENWQVIRAHIEKVDVILTGLLAEGKAAGEFVLDDPAVTAPCVRAAMMRFCHPHLLAQCAEIPAPTVEQQVDFILAALVGPGR